MNLKNFEKYFDTKILNRGREYYLSGAVLSIENIDENEYTAEVEGSEDYEVSLEMDDNGEVYNISCDCPYDMDEYCKHQAAVLYALRNKNENIIKTSVNKSNLSQLLGKCNTTQLVEIILEHAKEDKSFRNYLQMKLSEVSDLSSVISDFKRISDTYFNGRSDVNNVLKAGNLLINKIEKFDSLIDRVQIYAEIISMLENGIENAYDEEAWELLDMINDCSSYMEVTVTNILDSENQTDIASAWQNITKCWGKDFGLDGEERFFSSLFQFCVFPEYRNKLDEILAFRAMFASEYRKKKIDEQRFSIVKKYGTETQISDFINSHIDNSDFRRMAIEQAINIQNYAKAEQLALDGLDEDKLYFSGISNWQRLLCDIYRISKNTQKLIETCYILIKNGDTGYYEEWKSLISEKNRNDEIQRLLNEPNNFSYEYIISYENMSDRIYKFCCSIPSKITYYYERLKTTEFGEQSKNLYEKYIRNEGDKASNRSEYVIVCKKLRVFSLKCDAELAKKIVSDFREIYRRKPAFMDELTKAGF